jgi:CBS domain-containing protein
VIFVKVKDVMSPSPLTVSVDATVSEAAAILRKNRIGGLPVTDGEMIVAARYRRDQR